MLALAMLLTVIGCRQDNDAPAEVAGDTPEMAVLLKTLASPFWQAIEAGVMAEASRLGITVNVYAAAGEDDIEGQVTIMENLIERGYPVIGVAPLTPVNLNNAVSQATERGIYIINIDEQFDMEGLRGLGGAVQGFVTTDNVAVGAMGAEFIIEHVEAGAEVAIIEGMAGNVSGDSRKLGATQAFEAAGLNLVESLPANWDRTMAFDVASNLIDRFPNLKAIYCANDTMAMGALEAVRNSGRDIIVVGTDGNDDAVESVMAGELDATVAQDTDEIGAIAVRMMYDAWNNQPEIDPNAEVPFVAANPFLVRLDGPAVQAPADDEYIPEMAVLLKTLASPFWQAVEAGVMAEAEALGIRINVYAAAAEDDIEGQVTIMENLIERGYPVIGVSPLTPVNLNNAVSQATERGIYIINIDEQFDMESLVALGGAVQGFVTTDNVAVGAMGAEFIINQLEPGDEVVIIEGMAGNASGEARRQGALAAFEAAGIEVVESQPANWDRTMAFDVASNLIDRFPNLRAFYCANDTMAMGVLEAVRNSGREIIVVGTDGNDDAVESVMAGELGATVAQDTDLIGAIAVRMMLDVWRNQVPIDPGAEVPFTAADPFLVAL